MDMKKKSIQERRKMMRKNMCRAVLLLALGVSTNGWAAIWVGNGSFIDPNDNHWNVPSNWNSGLLPTASDDVFIDRTTRLQPLVDSTVTAYGNVVRIGGTAGGGTTNQLTVTGGSATFSGHCIVGQGTGSKAMLEVTGGTFQSKTLWVGNDGNGTVMITGGSIHLMTENLYVDRFNKTSSAVFLYGGVIDQNGGIYMGGGGVIDITEGTLILNGNQTGAVNSYITAGKIKAYNGASTVVVDYDTTNPGKTTVTAAIYYKAWKPSPEVGATVEDLEMNLSWMPGAGAVSHTIYFGTDEAAVAAGDASVLMGTQAETMFDPGLLTVDQTYYWRVDENDGSSTYAGDVWSFNALNPLQASSPNPANKAIGVSTQPLLSWTPGAGAVSHDVYFGTSVDSLELVSAGQSDPNYAPGMLIKGQQYFWRIDENDGGQITTGLVWSFTVVSGATSTRWTNNDPVSELWSSELNWDNGTPGLMTSVWIDNEPNVLIDDTVTAVGNVVRVSITNPVDANEPSIFMTGGSLTGSGDFVLGQGYGSKPVMEISGGTANIFSLWTGNMSCWSMGSSRLHVTGGTVNCSYLWVSRCSPPTGQEGAIQLDGGVINAGAFFMGNGNMDITAGTLIINGNVTGVINSYVTNGWITAYGGTGVLIVDYDHVNPGKTTVKACPSQYTTDFDGNCAIDLADLSMMISDWLFKTPAEIAWEFDMNTDPVGPGEYDLTLRNAVDTNYNMTDAPGMMHVTGNLLLEEQIPSSGLWNADLHYIARAETEAPLNLWVTMGTSASLGQQAYVGVSIALDSATNTQTVKIWTGVPIPVEAGNPVVITGFAPDALIDITVAYDYDTDTFNWTATDGTFSQSGNGVPYSAFNKGNGGSFTIQSENGAMGYIDYLSFTIYGSDWISPYDVQQDGVVDLEDIGLLASDWLK